MTYILHVHTKTDKINQGLGKKSKYKLWFWGPDSNYKRFFEHPLVNIINPMFLPNGHGYCKGRVWGTGSVEI